MGACGSKNKPAEAAAPSVGPAPAPAASKTKSTEPVDWKKVHSMVRWNKPVDEIKALIGDDKALASSVDTGNGNHPLHIAAQNGHLNLVKMLREHYECDIDCQNGTGQTPLHMALSYGYYHTVTYLVEVGADTEKVNNDGFAAKVGIEGTDKLNDPMMCLEAAENTEQAMDGLEMVLAATQKGEEVDKGRFIQTCMGMKKKWKETGEWTAELQASYTDIARSL